MFKINFSSEEVLKLFRVLEKRIDKLQCFIEECCSKIPINIGEGFGLFKRLHHNKWEFKSLKEGNNITITDDGETLTINSSGGGGSFTCSDLNTCSTTNLPEGTNLYYTNNRAITALTGQNISLFNNNSGYITSSALSPYLLSNTASSTYEPIISSGTTSEYWRGDKTWQTFPTIPSIAPSALTSIDDTNITLTLSGSPSTSLLEAVSLTLGWVGTLDDSRITSATTWNAKQNALGFTPEDSANKTDVMSGNTTSPTKYLSAKGVYDWVIGLGYATTASLSSYLTISSASATYATISSLSSYLTTATASSTYQAILTATNFGAFINGLTSKTTPIDADSLNIVDSTASNIQKKVSLTNFKAYLKTYFDTLYVSGSGFWSISGNSAGASDFIGTTNAVSFKIKVQNFIYGVLDYANNNVFWGYNTGTGTGMTNTNALGRNAGAGANSATFSNYIGNGAGLNATSTSNANFLGSSAGNGATGAYDSIFMGQNSGLNGVNAYRSVFLGTSAGNGSTANNSFFLGFRAGQNSTGNNNIAIGVDAGIGNTLSGKTIISNASMPSYLDRATALLAITVALGGVAGNTYLYYNQTTFAIEAVRL